MGGRRQAFRPLSFSPFHVLEDSMKKFFGLLMCATMACAFAIGCGDTKKKSTSTTTDKDGDKTTTTTTTDK